MDFSNEAKTNLKFRLCLILNGPKISNHFPKISEDSSKCVRRSHECCRTFLRKIPKITEDYRRLLKIFEEDTKIFRLYTDEFKYNLRDKLDISESIDILTSEDMENTPLEPRMWFRMNFSIGVFSSRHSCLFNK